MQNKTKILYSHNISPAAVFMLALVLGGCGESQPTGIAAAVPSGQAVASTLAPDAAIRDLAIAAPESVGMSSERLARLTDAMQSLVDQGQLAGVVTLVARHGKIVHFESVGYRDMEASAPMTNDTIFRIYSMSKPITGIALMMLYEEGKFRLSDPVEKYIPQLSNLQVATGVDANANVTTEPADHPMTIRELMSHTGGLTYGLFSASAVDSLYNERNVLDSTGTLQDMIEKLSAIPLRQQPGSLWHYSVGVDVQGYLVEVLSGMTFEEFLQQRLFEPLGMNDTAFHVAPDKVDRFAQVYYYGSSGELVPREWEQWPNDFLSPRTFFSGGAGLTSTATDYLRFAQMVLDGGQLDGVRILAPLTVGLMHRNQLPRGLPDNILGAPGTVFGLDFAVVTDPVEAETFSEGEFYWGGAAGTWFWIDPVEDLVFAGMIQQFGNNRPDVRSLSRRLTYAAIMDPSTVDP